MTPVFDPDTLHAIVCDSVGVPWPRAADKVVGDLDAAYPGRVQLGERRFILRNAGGAMGQVVLLHVSLHEVLRLYGSPIGTEGHTGRHGTETWRFMLSGQMWSYREGDIDRSVYRPGDAAYVGPGDARAFRLPDQGWMLEYVRGPVLRALPFGLADSLLSTLDFVTVGRTLGAYLRLTVANALPDARRSESGVLPHERYRRRGPVAQA